MRRILFVVALAALFALVLAVPAFAKPAECQPIHDWELCTKENVSSSGNVNIKETYVYETEAFKEKAKFHYQFKPK